MVNPPPHIEKLKVPVQTEGNLETEANDGAVTQQPPGSASGFLPSSNMLAKKQVSFLPENRQPDPKAPFAPNHDGKAAQRQDMDDFDIKSEIAKGDDINELRQATDDKNVSKPIRVLDRGK